MNHPLVTLAPFLFIGFVILLAIIIIPTTLRYSRRKIREAQNMLPSPSLQTL